MAYLYALDFDGVICDSAVETGITGWKAATHLWNEMIGEFPEPDLLDSFRRVRPVLEIGYEAILIMRLLYQGVQADELFEDYTTQINSLVERDNLCVSRLKTLFGKSRDDWIKYDYQGWINMNPLFPGMAKKLQDLNSSGLLSIVTTKQERFVKQILQANQFELEAEYIFGLDRNMSKPEVLKYLLRMHPDQIICFIEDRLPTLKAVVQHDDLQDVQLYLASWGYNTEQDRYTAGNYPIQLINLSQFVEC